MFHVAYTRSNMQTSNGDVRLSGSSESEYNRVKVGYLFLGRESNIFEELL